MQSHSLVPIIDGMAASLHQYPMVDEFDPRRLGYQEPIHETTVGLNEV